ncbi:MAG: Ni/Fe-hydrogenase cytochrome b subunit [Candidatus Kapabacteria bacterium]|nr:Ni/Fe-hydrogenase cytochrome b subunit [Candidatus Kapabacteria bacterium]
MSHLIAQPLKSVKFFTPGVIILIIIALNGIVFIAARFLFGLGQVTNLDNQYPWGLWIGVDVAAGVALAAGGFISAAIGHILHREHYHVIVRPALLTAMLGYTFVAFGVFIDIGRWYFIWHPLVMWNPNSALFEVGICVMIYLTVLYIEFLPIVTERFMNKVNLPGILRIFNNVINKILIALDSGLSKTMFVFIIAGVVLSSLHQSSLGTLMVIAGSKMHPLWQTPILPLLFLISAVGVGVPMIIFESLIASRSFKLEPEMPVLTRLASYVAPILGVYLSFKIGDMVIRKSFVYLAEFNTQSVMFLIEMIIGVVLPLIMFLNKKVLRSPLMLFIASSLVVFGVLLNRINNFVVAYHPPYANYPYFPSFGELSVTLGCAALLILLYRMAVMIFPIIATEDNSNHQKN